MSFRSGRVVLVRRELYFKMSLETRIRNVAQRLNRPVPTTKAIAC